MHHKTYCRFTTRRTWKNLFPPAPNLRPALRGLDAANISLLNVDQHFNCWISTIVSPVEYDQGIILGYKCHRKVKKLDGTMFYIMLKVGIRPRLSVVCIG